MRFLSLTGLDGRVAEALRVNPQMHGRDEEKSWLSANDPLVDVFAKATGKSKTVWVEKAIDEGCCASLKSTNSQAAARVETGTTHRLTETAANNK
jgi:hypothetical protein